MSARNWQWNQPSMIPQKWFGAASFETSSKARKGTIKFLAFGDDQDEVEENGRLRNESADPVYVFEFKADDQLADEFRDWLVNQDIPPEEYDRAAKCFSQGVQEVKKIIVNAAKKRNGDD